MSSALFIGCDRSDHKDTPSTPNPTVPSPATPQTPRTETPAAAPAAAQTPPAPAPALPDTGAVVNSAVSSATPAADTTNAAVTDAAAKLDQVTQYIKDHKLDLAESTLKPLEEHKAQLPVSIQPRVDDARKALNAAKAIANPAGALPALPK
jgi:hypothetical protein